MKASCLSFAAWHEHSLTRAGQGWVFPVQRLNGPRDDTFGIMAKLRQTVGDENFDYLVQFPSTAY